MEKFVCEVFDTVELGVKKLNSLVEEGYIVNNLNIINEGGNSNVVFVYSMRKVQNNNYRQNKQNNISKDNKYKPNREKKESVSNTSNSSYVNKILNEQIFDDSELRNRMNDKDRRKNNYENRKKYKR